MISILLPSRGRPNNIRRLHKSLEQTTKGKWQLLVRLDRDDPTLGNYPDGFELNRLSNVIGDRRLLSELWNELLPYVSGDIVMHGGDDIIFRTPGWDDLIRAAFPSDGIAFVHGDDLGGKGDRLGTHGFVTRTWVDTLGYLVPPLFASDYNDLWLNEVADLIGRRVFVPDVITEHLHPAFGKAEWDITHQERVERHKAEDVDRIWRESEHLRIADAEKLEAKIKTHA